MSSPLHADLVLRGRDRAHRRCAGPWRRRLRCDRADRGRRLGCRRGRDGRPRTRVLDLPRQDRHPGIHRLAHAHTYVGEFRYSFEQLNTAAELNRSIAEVLDKVRERAASTPAGKWIGGRNFDPNGMKERRWPTRLELDAVAPEAPVMITIRGGHACVANSLGAGGGRHRPRHARSRGRRDRPRPGYGRPHGRAARRACHPVGAAGGDAGRPQARAGHRSTPCTCGSGVTSVHDCGRHAASRVLSRLARIGRARTRWRSARTSILYAELRARRTTAACARLRRRAGCAWAP